jgi:hypothetical protein
MKSKVVVSTNQSRVLCIECGVPQAVIRHRGTELEFVEVYAAISADDRRAILDCIRRGGGVIELELQE